VSVSTIFIWDPGRGYVRYDLTPYSDVGALGIISVDQTGEAKIGARLTAIIEGAPPPAAGE
jgi:hypothetical protein